MSQKAQLQPYETLLEKLEEHNGDKLGNYDYLSQLRPLNILQSQGIRSLILRHIEKGKPVTAEFLIRTVAYVCNHLAPRTRKNPVTDYPQYAAANPLYTDGDLPQTLSPEKRFLVYST